MSAEATAWAWRVIRAVSSDGTGIGLAARMVLLKLADRADDRGVCWPGHEKTAMDCGLSEVGARKAALELEARGLLKVERRMDSSGRNLSNRYTLPLSLLFGPPPPPPNSGCGGGNGVGGNGVEGGGSRVSRNLKKD